MHPEAVHPAHWPTPVVPLSHGMRAGNLLFVSGQVATRTDGTVLIGDFAQEVNTTLDNVEAVLTAAGSSWQHLVKINAYLSNATLFAPFNEIYRKRFPGVPPARTTVIVAFGHPDVRVEVEAVAVVPEQD